MTYAKITTDDKNGKIKLYVGEGEFLKDHMDTEGASPSARSLTSRAF
jgi:L-fucose isomerase-like protein